MDKTQRIIVSILGGILGAVLVLVFLLAAGIIRRQEVLDFTPPPFDKVAIVGAPDLADREDYKRMDIGEGFSVSMCGAPVFDGTGAELYLTSPASNEVWVRVKIYDQSGALIGESGLLRPGEYVRSVPLTVAPDRDIPVTVKILSYEPETYYSLGSANANVTLSQSK